MPRATFKTSDLGPWVTAGAFAGDFADWTETERHGDFAVMTDGYAYRVLRISQRTFVWRDISPTKCAAYAKAMSR